MSFVSVCDGWMADITSTVTELTNATPHLYAPWSPEYLGDAGKGRHIAVWPEPNPEEVIPAVVGSPPSDFLIDTYNVIVWESAAADVTRIADDKAANAAWLDLFEAVRARFYVQANTSVGVTGGYTRYVGGNFGIRGTVRFFSLVFTVRVPRDFT